jgi:hypothetical protein
VWLDNSQLARSFVAKRRNLAEPFHSRWQAVLDSPVPPPLLFCTGSSGTMSERGPTVR